MKERIIARLFDEFKNSRQQKEFEADEKLNRLIKSNEELFALEKAFREAEIAVAKVTALGGDTKKAAAVRDKAKNMRDGWFSKNGYQESDFLPDFSCKVCCDSGVLGNKYCNCFSAKLNKRLAEHGMAVQTNTFKTSDLSIIKDAVQRERLQKIYAVAQDFCEKYPYVAKKNLALIGKTGAGKTYLLSAVVAELEEKGFDVFFLTAFGFNNLMLKHHTSFDEDKMLYLDQLLNCDALAIDDLGSEPIYKNVTKEYLYSIINERNIKNKCTLFSSNLFPIELKNHYGDRIAFRLLDKDKTTAIEFTGDDLRVVKG